MVAPGSRKQRLDPVLTPFFVLVISGPVLIPFLRTRNSNSNIVIVLIIVIVIVIVIEIVIVIVIVVHDI